MSTNTELIARLRLGASISRERKLNQGYDAVADEAADAIEALEAQNSANMATCKGIIQGLQTEVERLTTLARGQHIELYNARLQLAAAQGQEPIDAVPLDDMVEGSHPSYGRGLFATDNCVKQFYAAPIPQQPASLLALLTTRSILIRLYEKLGGVIKSSTPISREIEPWPRVSITEESLCDLRKIWESLPKMQEDLMRHIEAAPQPKETK